ncbi:MAG: hypothetical protein KBG73_11175 [Candidatus Promineofilum sp.]|nr:hypothetical protein [Promineifilum sp.]
MLRKWLSTTVFMLLAFVLAACGGSGELPAPTSTPEAGDATTSLPVEPTQSAATAAPATAAPPTAPTVEASTAEPTAAPAVLCPNVPRPALLLSIGTSFELHDPLGGERCVLPIAEDIGPEVVAGDRAYFLQRDVDLQTIMVARIGPDGVIETLPGTQGAGDTYYLQQFAVAPDESRLAWSSAEPQSADNPMTLMSTMWIGAADASNPVTVFEDMTIGENRIATPVRFTADGQTLFFTWQPMGLGGGWSSFVSRYDNLYRVPVTGGEIQKVFDCADQELFLCIGDFRDDGTLAYVDGARAVRVVGPDGAELATIPTVDDYTGYPTFSPSGDLIYSTAALPTDSTAPFAPAPGAIYRVAAPYTGEPEMVASAVGLLTMALPHPFLDNQHLVVSYAEGEMWGSAVLDTSTGTITRLEPWPNAYLSAVWPAP